MTGIYQIQSIVNPERIYIGSAVNINYRWTLHLSNLNLNKHHSPKLQNHYNKYGKDDLTFSIISEYDKEDLTQIEQYYLYDTYFNICKVAGSCLGVKRSEETNNKHRKTRSKETCDKISKALSGKPSSLKGKQGHPSGRKGKHLPKEHCDNISKSMLGKSKSEEAKMNMSKAQIGNINALGYKHTDDELLKMRTPRHNKVFIVNSLNEQQ